MSRVVRVPICTYKGYTMQPYKLTIQFSFAPYDMRIGPYYDPAHDILYLHVLPFVMLRIYIAGEGFRDRRINLAVEEKET